METTQQSPSTPRLYLNSILVDPLLMLGDIHIAIGQSGTTAADKEGGNAHQLVIVDRRSTSIAGTESSEILGHRGEAEQILLLQVQFLVAVTRTQDLPAGHLEAMAKRSLRLAGSPAREADLGSSRRTLCGQVNGFDIRIQVHLGLQLQ